MRRNCTSLMPGTVPCADENGRLIGIVNTLSLSILERRRELGLLRVEFKTTGDADNTWISEEFGHMKTLAGVETFGAGTDTPKPAHAAVFVAGDMTVYVPLEGLVDFAAGLVFATARRTHSANVPKLLLSPCSVMCGSPAESKARL